MKKKVLFIQTKPNRKWGVGCEGKKGFLLLENELEQGASEERGTGMRGAGLHWWAGSSHADTQ